MRTYAGSRSDPERGVRSRGERRPEDAAGDKESGDDAVSDLVRRPRDDLPHGRAARPERLIEGDLESTEHISGGVIEAPDLDVALQLAAEAARACQGKVEVRPFPHG